MDNLIAIPAKRLIKEVEKRGVGAEAELRGTGLGSAWLKDHDQVCHGKPLAGAGGTGRTGDGVSDIHHPEHR